MRRIHKIILVECVLLAAVGGISWYLFFPGPGPVAARALAPAAAPQGSIPVPSGQVVSPLDRSEEDGVVRYRFLAPAIAEGSAGEEAASDMQALCEGYVLANLPDPANPPEQVIVTLAEKAVEIGESRPDVVQFFEAFGIEDGKCVWEMF